MNNSYQINGIAATLTGQTLETTLVKYTGSPKVRMPNSYFPDNSPDIEIWESEDVRGKNIALVTRYTPDPATTLLEITTATDLLKEFGAKHIRLITPYQAYTRGDKRSQKKAAKGTMEAVYLKTVLYTLIHGPYGRRIDDIVTMDPHISRIPGTVEIFGMPIRTISMVPILKRRAESYFELETPTVLAPDFGADPIADYYGGYAFQKTRKSGSEVIITNGREEKPISGDYMIIDDIIATGGTMKKAARILKKGGANKVIAVGTHVSVGPNIIAKLANYKYIDGIVVADTTKKIMPERADITEVRVRVQPEFAAYLKYGFSFTDVDMAIDAPDGWFNDPVLAAMNVGQVASELEKYKQELISLGASF